MRIATYWWGAELFPDSDEEWELMLKLFQNVEVVWGTEEPIEIDHTGADQYGHRIGEPEPGKPRRGPNMKERHISISRE